MFYGKTKMVMGKRERDVRVRWISNFMRSNWSQRSLSRFSFYKGKLALIFVLHLTHSSKL